MFNHQMLQLVNLFLKLSDVVVLLLMLRQVATCALKLAKKSAKSSTINRTSRIRFTDMRQVSTTHRTIWQRRRTTASSIRKRQ